MSEAVEAAGGGLSVIVDSDDWRTGLKTVRQAGTNLNKVTLLGRPNTTIPVPLTAFVGKIQKCSMHAKFFDTFYEPKDTKRDYSRLQLLNHNPRLSIHSFYGYLNSVGIALLPHTIGELGLAIHNAVVARAVLTMETWPALYDMRVSVSTRVDVDDLSPLPAHVDKTIFFPGLTDARVTSIKPAIQALVPDLKLNALYFPQCKLTSEGAKVFAEQPLQDVVLTYSAAFELGGDWKPDEEEKEVIANLFKVIMSPPKVKWNMEFLYTAGL